VMLIDFEYVGILSNRNRPLKPTNPSNLISTHL
jgi:hypothetical protein